MIYLDSVRRLVKAMIPIALFTLSGCALETGPLLRDRVHFNEWIKTTGEQQMLLNIVRLRYNDTPSSLAVSSVATQTEVSRSVGLFPFFGVVGGEAQARAATRILPQAQVSVSDRPTVTLTPLDDSEFTRKLFTPMTLESVLYLAKTTWPIATVFQLFLENLNWISNGQTGSGPTPTTPPDFERFREGINALQRLQDRGQIVFTSELRDEPISAPIGTDKLSAADLIEAAKNSFEYRPIEGTLTSILMKKRPQPMMRIDPTALETSDMAVFASAFMLQRNRAAFDITIERLDPFFSSSKKPSVDLIDLETRSLLQVLYFLSKGVEVPRAHSVRRIVQDSADASGTKFDWRILTKGLFEVASDCSAEPGERAFVAVRYLDCWYFIDRRDQQSLSTFSLLQEVARLENNARPGSAPTLTIPLSGR